MTGERIDFDRVGRKLELLRVELALAAVLGEDIASEAPSILQPTFHAACDRRRDAARQQDGRDQRGADDAERDLLDSCQRQVENAAGLRDRRKSDQSYRIAR